MNQRTKTSLVILILMVGDVIVIYLSFTLGAAIRTLLIPWLHGRGLWASFNSVVGLEIFYIVSIFSIFSLYPGYGLTSVTEIERLVKSTSVAFILFGITVYVLRIFTNFPRSIYLFTWLISIVLLSVWRIMLRNRLSLMPFYGSKFVLVLENDGDLSIIDVIRRCRRLGWTAAAALSLGKDVDLEGVGNENLIILKNLDELSDYNQNAGIDTVFVSNQLLDKDSSLLRRLTNNFKRIVMVYPFSDMGSVWVKPLDLEGQLGLELSFHLLEPWALVFKRGVDLIFSILLLLILSPLVLLLAIIIRVDSPGPVFFSHRRVGKGGEPFGVFKFRTMFSDAEERLNKMLAGDSALREEFDEYHKLDNDPRITAVGKWIRKFSLDEIPQFWNVVRGEMSLIGPRAVTKGEVEAYGDKADVILRVRPGITGWWQVMGRHRTSWEQRVRLEMYYVSNWSLWMDVYIALKTIWVIVTGQGA